MTDHDTLVYWLETILNEASDDLNDWESKFIDDMEVRIRAGWPLTDSQIAKLEQIYASKTK